MPAQGGAGGFACACLASDRREFEEILDLRTHGAVESLNFGVGRFDDQVLVRSMRTVTVSKSKVTGRELQRLTSKDISGPGAGESRPEDWLNSVTAIEGSLRLNERRVLRRGGRIVASRHIHFDVAEPAFGEVRFNGRQRALRGHIRDEAQI